MGSGCVREKLVVGGLGGFTDGDVEIGGDNWIFCEVLVGDGRELVVGIIASCRLEVLGVGVAIGFSFEGFCFVERFLKLYGIIGNLCITG